MKKITKKKDSIIYRVLRNIYHKIIYIFYPFGYIRNYIIFPIKAYLRVHHVKKFYNDYKFLDDIKNKHKGERCFILATGPSLRVEDVEKLSDETTIAVNSFYKIYNQTQFRPTYYVVLDPDVQSSFIEKCPYQMNEVAKKMIFMNDMEKDKRKGINYIPYCYQDHWFNIFNTKYDYSKNLKFSDNLLWGMYDKYTVTNAAIELAIHMGFKEIYLLGVDCNYNGPKKYFVQPDKDTFSPNELQAMLTQKAMMTGYNFMEREAKKRKIDIFNATRGGMLEEFERVEFDKVIGKGGILNDNAK